MLGPVDHRHMSRALALARRGLFTAHPNPRVGCVLVRGDDIIGEGWHERTGSPHAEVNALAQAGERAHGATLYVTLEPCCHQGGASRWTQAARPKRGDCDRGGNGPCRRSCTDRTPSSWVSAPPMSSGTDTPAAARCLRQPSAYAGNREDVDLPRTDLGRNVLRQRRQGRCPRPQGG